jgi:drug/metabolite transporter (DMT)-like permease
MKRAPIPPVLVLALGILAVSAASIFIRFAQREANSLVISAWRLALATLVLAPFVLTQRREELRGLKRSDLGLALLSGIFLAVHFAAWISSLAYTSVASSVVLVSTAPLWVALLSPLALKEPLARPVLVGMLLALAGGVIVSVSDTCGWGAGGLTCPPLSEFVRGRAFWGDLLALTGAWAVAGYLIIGRRLRVRVSLLSYIFVVYGMAALVMLVVVLAAGLPFIGFSPVTYLMLLGLALIPQLLGHTTYNYALAYLSAAYVSVAALGEPVGSSILAYFLLGETPGVLKLIGAVLILAGIYIASRNPAAPVTAEAG